MKGPPAAKSEPPPPHVLLQETEFRDANSCRLQFPCVTQGGSQEVFAQVSPPPAM